MALIILKFKEMNIKLDKIIIFLGVLASVTFGYNSMNEKQKDMNNSGRYVAKLMTVDPGHFHAALVQKVMYPEVSPKVFVYAPEGPDVRLHLDRINSFNNREKDPTKWETKVYTGDDFFNRMITEQPGNVMVVAGNNAKKTEFILEAVKNGIHVLADKPMVITPDEFPMLEQAFAVAKKNNVLLYDVMTERYEVTTVLQKELAQIPEVFGELEKGSPEEPAITKESVHHFFKYVSGKPLIRPPWFYDVEQEGDGIVDVSTHLVDLIQWECFPGQIIDRKNVAMLKARRWPTRMNSEMFGKTTGMAQFPEYLQKDIVNDTLHVYCNGEFVYKINGVHAKVSVIWNFQAPEGTGDTHYSIMRGSKANLIIRQGEKEDFKPVLYIESVGNEDISKAVNEAVNKTLQKKFEGLTIDKISSGKWKVNIPAKYKVGHEAHFGQVTEKFLKFLKDQKMPEWEVPNMIVKYYITTEALRMAKEKGN
jgi:predicted dehydrogenase